MTEQAMYGLVSWLLEILKSPVLWYIAGPLITIRLVVRFLRWTFSTARGERDSEALEDAASGAASGLENRLNYGRSYRPLRGSGFSDGELHSIRRGRFRF